MSDNALIVWIAGIMAVAGMVAMLLHYYGPRPRSEVPVTTNQDTVMYLEAPFPEMTAIQLTCIASPHSD